MRTYSRNVDVKILIPVAVLLGAIVVAAVSYERHRWEAPPHTRLPYPVLDGLTTLTVLGILAITLSRSGGRGGTRVHLLPLSDFWETDTYRETLVPGIISAAANFILFIPFGFLAGVRWRLFDRWSTILALAAGLSLTIEIIQVGLGGHDTSIDRVLLNTLGAMFGHGLMTILRDRDRPRFALPRSGSSTTGPLAALPCGGDRDCPPLVSQRDRAPHLPTETWGRTQEFQPVTSRAHRAPSTASPR
jgi:glycopeptide antibiotics resistance protein